LDVPPERSSLDKECKFRVVPQPAGRFLYFSVVAAPPNYAASRATADCAGTDGRRDSDMAIRTQTKGIAFRLVGATTAMFACLLAECTSPNSADYAAAAADRARQAREESALAEQHAAASAILRDQGDETGAAISHDAADEAARDAYWQRLQAAKDEWLSRWWPVR
jgi:hypothetical protein